MKKFISNAQILSVLYCVIFAYGVINLPQRVAKSAGTGGWVSLLIATIIFVFITYIITKLQYTFEGKTLPEYSQKLTGKFFTYIIAIFNIAYCFTFFTMLTRGYCDTIRIVILSKTPVIYLCLLFYLVLCYVLLNGLNVIARICQIYGFIIIIGTIVINTILFTQGEIVQIKPLFVTNNIMVYLKAVLQMILPLAGIEIAFVIPLSRNINKGIHKYSILLMAFIGLLYIYIVESAFSVGGVSLIINSQVALFSISNGVDVPFAEIFLRLDIVYLIVWTMLAMCSLSMWGYAVVTFINKIFKNINYSFVVIITTTISFILSQVPRSMKQVDLILNINAYFGILIIFIIPCILYAITKVKKYDKKFP